MRTLPKRPLPAAPLSRFFALALAGFLLAGCTDPFDPFGRIASLPWGVQLNRPEGTQLVHDKGGMYLYPAREGWSLVLAVRRLPPGVPAARDLGPAAARALMEEARRAAAPHVRIVEWELRPFGLIPALWIRFEGPPGRGQAGIPFLREEQLFHLVALLTRKRRAYLLHLRAREAALTDALSVWEETAANARFAGEPDVGFPGSEDVPVGTLRTLVREAFGGEPAGPGLPGKRGLSPERGGG